MRFLARTILRAAVVVGLGALAFAQSASVTVNDPPGATPDPTHVPFVLPKDIKWTGDPNRQLTAILYGDPSKEGPYTLVYKWMPGAFSRPHFHDKVRWAYVISGTWWVSSSNVYDERTTYPLACRHVHDGHRQHGALGRRTRGRKRAGRYRAVRHRPREDDSGGHRRQAAAATVV